MHSFVLVFVCIIIFQQHYVFVNVFIIIIIKILLLIFFALSVVSAKTFVII